VQQHARESDVLPFLFLSALYENFGMALNGQNRIIRMLKATGMPARYDSPDPAASMAGTLHASRSSYKGGEYLSGIKLLPAPDGSPSLEAETV